MKNLTQNTHVLGNVCCKAVLLIMAFKVWSISREPCNTCNHVQFSIWRSQLFPRTTLIEICRKNGGENRYSEDRWELTDIFCYTISLWFFWHCGNSSSRIGMERVSSFTSVWTLFFFFEGKQRLTNQTFAHVKPQEQT